MTGEPPTAISILSAEDVEGRLGELAALLHACVQAGASVNFVLPFTPAEQVLAEYEAARQRWS